MSSKFFSNLTRWLWRLGKVAIAICITAGAIYWFRFRPVVVISHEVVTGEVIEEVLGTGTLEARVQATVSPKISGRIENILVDEGEQVASGQLLFQLDGEELSQQVAIAEADVDGKQASITRVESDVSRANAVLKQAKSNHLRMISLSKQSAVSQDELDKAAEALSIAESEVARVDAAIAEARMALVVAQRTLEFQKTRLEDSRIVAPFAGLIVRRQRDPGDVVVAGSPVLLLISTEQLWINAWVDETEMSQLHVGQPAKVVFRSESNVNLAGTIARLAKETDRETREFVVDVEVKELPDNWAVGQRAEVYIETRRSSDAVVIPARFLSNNNNQTGVFLDDNGSVGWQEVVTGLRGREQIEIRSGLSPGDRIIMSTNPNRPLRIGMRTDEP